MDIIRLGDVEKYVYGGAVLGGGGGGSIEEGVKIGRIATQISPIKLLDVDEMRAEENLVTISMVGVQSKGVILPYHHIRIIELMKMFNVNVDGLIGSECGATAVTHGWIQAAVYGKPVVDCPCDGRAHPTGVMGAMGLHKIRDYRTVQVACGGEENLEIIVSGSIEATSRIIRQFSMEAGGCVAVARNPVKVDYAKRNGAPGALKQAYKIGEAILSVDKPEDRIESAMKTLNGKIICRGEVRGKRMEVEGGFDVGYIEVVDEGNELYKVAFVNEYMSVHKWDETVTTFPNLINVFSLKTGLPLNSAEVKLEDPVAITVTDKNAIKIGEGLRDRKLYEPIKRIMKDKLNLEVEFKI
ncbi:MAG: DUF917 family protein [archaeon YNP-WB-062]|jgi:DUF917 family protein|nr:DUF917 family protein [Candidatus Culexarchaeum yellowstonense]